MAVTPFISIGTRGTSIPIRLLKLEPGLKIGSNSLRWDREKDTLGNKAHAFVSKRYQKFELYTLKQALDERHVKKIEGASWTVQGKQYNGQAFLPSWWKQGDPLPQYVAVSSPKWRRSGVESRLRPDHRNKAVYGKVVLPPQRSVKAKMLHTPSILSPRKWTRNEILVLMNVYDKLPFGQFDEDQPVIKAIARKMNRTGGSIAMKLGNLASLDPAVLARGRKGLSGASNLDRAVWNEFTEHRSDLAPQSEELFRKLFRARADEEVELIKKVGVRVRKSLNPPVGPTENSVQRKVRRGQDYFRQVVLNAYDSRCCITGIAVPELLVASHIKPWRVCNDEERLRAQNGLCLSKLHDAAFDAFLITLDDKMRLMLSRRLREYFPSASLEQAFVPYQGKSIQLPGKLLQPDPAFLEFHRKQFLKR